MILLAILYVLYRLGQEEYPYGVAFSEMSVYKIVKNLREEQGAKKDDPLFENLQPEDVDTIREIISALKLVINLTNEDNYGSGRVKQIQNNLESDLGFAFAFMSYDLEKLCAQSKPVKQNFLNELKELVHKYSDTKLGLERYE